MRSFRAFWVFEWKLMMMMMMCWEESIYYYYVFSVFYTFEWIISILYTEKLGNLIEEHNTRIKRKTIKKTSFFTIFLSFWGEMSYSGQEIRYSCNNPEVDFKKWQKKVFKHFLFRSKFKRTTTIPLSFFFVDYYFLLQYIVSLSCPRCSLFITTQFFHKRYKVQNE